MTSVSTLPARNSTHEIPDGCCMRTASNRLKTFGDWPCAFLEPADLASAGFYYTKKEDIVKCASCGVEVGRWVKGDDAFKEHKRWAPNCLLVKSFAMPSGARPDQGEDTCGRYGIQIRPNSFPEGECRTADANKLRLLTREPTYPQYRNLHNRLLSFGEWPRSMKQKPAELADAGFFYTGKGDQTICYCCGGGLKDWEENDVPWEQHAVWFPKCSYLLLKKSPAYVEQVNNKRSEEAATSAACSETCDKKPEECPATEAPARSETNTKEPGENVSGSSTVCKICYVKEVGVVFLPCGHVVACVDCAPELSQCVMCRKPLEAAIRAFLS